LYRRVNANADFYAITSSADGDKNEVPVQQNVGVWIEEKSVFGYIFTGMTPRRTGKDSPVSEIGKMLMFVWDNIDIKPGDKVVINNKNYTIVGIDGYTDPKGQFHHREVILR